MLPYIDLEGSISFGYTSPYRSIETMAAIEAALVLWVLVSKIGQTSMFLMKGEKVAFSIRGTNICNIVFLSAKLKSKLRECQQERLKQKARVFVTDNFFYSRVQNLLERS